MQRGLWIICQLCLAARSIGGENCNTFYSAEVSEATFTNGTDIRNGCDIIIQAGPAGSGIELEISGLSLGFADYRAENENGYLPDHYHTYDFLNLYLAHSSTDEYRFARISAFNHHDLTKAPRFVATDGHLRISVNISTNPEGSFELEATFRRIEEDSPCGCPSMVSIDRHFVVSYTDIGGFRSWKCHWAHGGKWPAPVSPSLAPALTPGSASSSIAPIGGSVELHIAKGDIQLPPKLENFLEVLEGNGSLEITPVFENYYSERVSLPRYEEAKGELGDVVVLSRSRDLRLVTRYPKGAWEGGYKGVVRALSSPCAATCGRDEVLEAAVGEVKELFSPNYHNGSCGGLRCSWIIRAPPGHVLNIHNLKDDGSLRNDPSALLFADRAVTRYITPLEKTFHMVDGELVVHYVTPDEAEGFYGDSAKLHIRYSAEPKKEGCSCPEANQRGAMEGVVKFSSKCEEITCLVFVHPPSSIAQGSGDIYLVSTALGQTGANMNGKFGMLNIGAHSITDPWVQPKNVHWARTIGAKPEYWTGEGDKVSLVMARPAWPVAFQFNRDGHQLQGDVRIAYKWQLPNCSCDVGEIRLESAGQSANWSTPQFPDFPYCPNTTCSLQIRLSDGLGVKIDAPEHYYPHDAMLYFLRNTGQSCGDVEFRIGVGSVKPSDSLPLACESLGLDASGADSQGHLVTYNIFFRRPHFSAREMRLVFKSGPKVEGMGFRIRLRAVELSTMGLVSAGSSAGSVFLGIFLGLLLCAVIAGGLWFWRRRTGKPIPHMAFDARSASGGL